MRHVRGETTSASRRESVIEISGHRDEGTFRHIVGMPCEPHRKSRLLLAAALARASSLLAAPLAFAQAAPQKIRIAWVISKTGGDAPGAAASTTPNYQMWVKEVNAAGGLMLKGYIAAETRQVGLKPVNTPA